MTAQQIIEDVARNEKYKAICKKVAGGSDLHNDLFQEVIITLMGQPSERIEDMSRRKVFEWYVIGLIDKMWNRDKGEFYNTHRRYGRMACILDGFDLSIDAQPIDEDKYSRQLRVASEALDTSTEALNKVSESEAYSRYIFNMYMSEGSLQKVSNITGIPKRTVGLRVQKVKEQIKSKYERGK